MHKRLFRGISLAEIAVALVIVSLVGAYLFGAVNNHSLKQQGYQAGSHLRLVGIAAADTVIFEAPAIRSDLNSQPVGGTVSYTLGGSGAVETAWMDRLPASTAVSNPLADTIRLVVKKKNTLNEFESMLITTPPNGSVQTEALLAGASKLGAAGGIYQSDTGELSGLGGTWSTPASNWANHAESGSLSVYLEYDLPDRPAKPLRWGSVNDPLFLLCDTFQSDPPYMTPDTRTITAQIAQSGKYLIHPHIISPGFKAPGVHETYPSGIVRGYNFQGYLNAGDELKMYFDDHGWMNYYINNYLLYRVNPDDTVAQMHPNSTYTIAPRYTYMFFSRVGQYANHIDNCGIFLSQRNAGLNKPYLENFVFAFKVYLFPD